MNNTFPDQSTSMLDTPLWVFPYPSVIAKYNKHIQFVSGASWEAIDKDEDEVCDIEVTKYQLTT